MHIAMHIVVSLGCDVSDRQEQCIIVLNIVSIDIHVYMK